MHVAARLGLATIPRPICAPEVHRGSVTQLNPRQREAVRYVDGPCLVLAGAGSGKTSVITRKIAYLTGRCDLPARHTPAWPFTTKAARERKERIAGLVNGKAARALT